MHVTLVSDSVCDVDVCHPCVWQCVWDMIFVDRTSMGRWQVEGCLSTTPTLFSCSSSATLKVCSPLWVPLSCLLWTDHMQCKAHSTQCTHTHHKAHFIQPMHMQARTHACTHTHHTAHSTQHTRAHTHTHTATCIHCPADASQIRHVSVVRHVSVSRLMRVRSDMYQLSGMYQLAGWCESDPICISCPACIS